MKNFIQKGNKKVWSLITILIGILNVAVAVYLPETILYGIVAISGATIFYDTIFKSFENIFKKSDGGGKGISQ